MTGKRQRFLEYVDTTEPDLTVLPLIHITDAYHLLDIISPKQLLATPCKVFNKDILYTFYGKPAYRTKHGGNFNLCCYLPCAFILDTKKIEAKISRIYPFDSGAFCAGLLSNFFHSHTEISDFELPSDINYASKVVGTFFTNNEEYFHGGSRKNVNIPPMNFEAEGFWELCKQFSFPDARGARRLDERATAVEILFEQNIDLSESIIGCIVPHAALNDLETEAKLKELNCNEIISYNSYNGIGYEGISAILYDKIESFLKIKGYL